MFSRRKPRFAILISAFLLTMPLVVASPAAIAAPASPFLALDLPMDPLGDPEEVIAAGLARLAEQLNELPTLDGLQDAIPLSDTTLAEALGLIDRFTKLKDDLEDLVDDPTDLTDTALESVIELADGSGLTLTPDVLPQIGDIIPVTLGFAISKSITIPFSSGDGFPVSGGSVDGTASLNGSFSFELDTSKLGSDLDNAFYILTTPAPTLTIDISADVDPLNIADAQLGFTDVSLSGSAEINLAATLTVNDPDTTPPSDGKITFDEFDATTLLDLVSFDIVDEAAKVADVSLSIDSSLINDAGEDGTFTFQIENVGDSPTIGGDLGVDLPDFQNFSAAEALGALERLATLLSGLQTTGNLDVELPLVGGSLKDVFKLDGKLLDALDALIVELPSTDPGPPPIGPAFDSAQQLVASLAANLDGATVTHANNALLFTLAVTDSATENVYIGSTPPEPAESGGDPATCFDGLDNDDDGDIDSLDEACEQPIFLRFPDLDVLNDVEITAGATASLAGEYALNLTFGLDLTPEPTEGPGAEQGSCSDGVDNDGDGRIDAVDDPKCDGARNLEERVFLEVGTTAGSVEASARARFDATNIDAKARIGILDVGIDGAGVTIGGTAEGDAIPDNAAEIALDLVDTVDGRLTIRDLFNTIGLDGAPTGASLNTALTADFSANVPVVAEVSGLALDAGSIAMNATAAGVDSPSHLLENLNIVPSLSTDLLSFSPCSNGVDDDGDGDINDGCPGSGVPANDKPESESTAGLTQIIAAIRAFAQNLEGVGGGLLDEPLPLVGRSLNDLIDFSDVILAAAEDLENPAESDGSLDGGPDCHNNVDDDGDDVVNDGCPTNGTSPEGGGLATATNSNCLNNVDDDASDDPDNRVNDGCPAVNPTLDRVDEIITDAIQEALNEAAGVLAPTAGVTLAFDAAAKELTFDFQIDSAFERMGSFNVDLGGSLGDLVGLDAAGDVGINVAAELDLGFGVDLDTLTPFIVDTSGFVISAQADADDIELSAGIGPIEFGVGAPGDAAEAHLGGQYTLNLGGSGDRIEFSALTWPTGTFAGIDQGADCADATDDGCATLPIYLGDSKLGEVEVQVNDITVPDIDVDVPPALLTEITDAIAEELLNFALIESGLGRLIEVVTSLIADGLLAVEIPLIGDDINKIAKFIDGIGSGTDTDGDGIPDTSGLLSIIQGLVAGGDPFELAAAEETAKGNEQEVFVALDNPAAPEVQTIEVTGADGGTFDVSFDGSETATVDWNESTAGMEAALEGLTTIDGDNVSVSGSGPWTVTFTNALRDRDLDPITVDGTDLTHPDQTPAVDVTTDTDGIGGTFTLSTDGGTASGPIPWDASPPEIEDALLESPDFTAVNASGDGTEGTPWNLADFTPADPGELEADTSNLDGTATVTLVSAIPSVGDAQTFLDSFTADMKQALFDAGLLLDAGDPTFETQAAAIGDGQADLTVVCDPDPCDDNDPATTIAGIRFDILLGQAADATGSVDYEFDLGVPGLDLAAKGTPGVEGKWKIGLGLELNKDDGFFIDVDSGTPELLASVEAFLTDPDAAPPSPPNSLEGRIAFVGIDLYDGTVGLDPCSGAGAAAQGDPCNPGGDTLDPSLVKAQFEIDIVDPGTSADDGKFTFAELTNSPRVSDIFEAKIQAAADINLHLESFIADTGASLPRIYADVQLYWAWAKGSAGDEVTITRDGLAPDGTNEFNFTGDTCSSFTDCFEISLNNANMDAGSFVSSFLAPILEDVQKFTKPLQPVFDTLNKPIPVQSDLGPEPVTLLSLAKALGPADNKYGFIFDLIDLITFINDIETDQDRLIIPLGSPNDFTLATGRLLDGPVAPEQAMDAFSTALPTGNLVDGGGLDRPVTGGGQSPKDLKSSGLSFPFLEQPSKVLGLLFGQDVDLIVWQPKPLEFGFSYSQKFGPIWAVPPVFLEVGGSVSVTGRFGIGYDTQGLREILFEDAGPGALLHGVFLLDRDASGRDVNELELSGELFANAQVSILIFSAGAGGSVFATIGVDLQDPNADGKLKFPEIADIIRATGNPFCIFNLNGQFGVRMFVFAEVDLFFWSKRWRKDLAEIILYEFKIECDDLVEPVLAKGIAGNSGDIPTAAKDKYGLTSADDVLRLNLGKFQGGRDANGQSIGSGIGEEEFTVTQEVDDSLTVQGFGFQQNYGEDDTPSGDGTWELVLIDGRDDAGDDKADTVIFLDGGDEDPTSEADLDGAATPFTVPAYIFGSPEKDSYILGGGNDTLMAGGGNDTADGRGGNDALDGDAGDDSLNGGPGTDTLNGGDNDDYLEGGPGGDFLNGNGGDDEIVGGATEGSDADGVDNIDGGPGNDDIDGGPAGDNIDGGPDKDNIQGGEGDDNIDGGEGGDEAASCPADGGPGAGDPQTGGDVIYGGPGMDTINGEGGDDYIVGGSSIDESLDEKDVIHGDEGCDTIWGDNVEIKPDGSVVGQIPSDTNEYGPDVIYGDADNDLILGQNGNDDIFGGDGKDDLTGNEGDDFILGDDGTINDRAAADVTVTEDAGDGADTIRGSDGSDHLYGGGDVDTMFGDDDADFMFGNSGNDIMRGGRDNDEMSGNQDSDEMFGDSGDDTMWGDDADDTTSGDAADEMRGGIGNDYMFGNAGGDDMKGDSGDDRMVGGSADGGEADNVAPDRDEMRGGSGADVMTGDNATISNAAVRVVILQLDGEGAGDLMFGDTEADRMFGQTGDDEIYGGNHNDYVEGNDGSDDIHGEDGNDDLIGGGSAKDVGNIGLIDADRTGDGLPDVGDEIRGGSGVDWIAGDNARIDRNFDLGLTADLVLFDVNSTDVSTSGGDRIHGDGEGDVIFGQGNGSQDPENEGDAPDGVDNDLDAQIDEDGGEAVGGFLGDIIWGGAGADYIEGNHGADLIRGEADEDDLIGGGSSDSSGADIGVVVGDGGVVDSSRNGSGLEDGRDTMYGQDSVDLMTGDNALIARKFGTNAIEVVLFDVNSIDPTTSSGDYMSGGGSNDLMFGQGNGSQGNQADPIDGNIDNDLDGTSDDDKPWLGDVMFGNAENDYMEGNHGADLMYGGTGTDDMVGGGSANDESVGQTGSFTGDRTGDGLDDGRDVMYGESGEDWMAGDNALIERNEQLGAANDFVLFDVNSPNETTSGGDYMDGGAQDDRMFGQGNGAQLAQSDPLDGVDNDGDGVPDENQPWFGDVMLGGTGGDYMEGNHGSDVMWGDDNNGSEANDGEDDMIGGGSASDGVIVGNGGGFDTTRTGNGLEDDGDVMRGEGEVDFMAGDNARIDKTGVLTGLTLPTTSDRSVQLFDVELSGNPLNTAFSGGDWMSGGGEDDVMFGQGNGDQGDQADPLDGVDNDLDGREDGDPNDADDLGYDCGDFEFDNDGDLLSDGLDPECIASIDEDKPWFGDVMWGNSGEDYMEGNHGADWMFGDEPDGIEAGDGEDDMIGGGSANDGAIDPDRDPMGLTDGTDVMYGNGEDDVMTGDNARINREANGADWLRITNAGIAIEDGFGDYAQAVRVTDMFAGDAGADTHGNDYMEGNGGNDEMYGQLGDDFAIGNEGDDSLVGDLGQVTANIIGDDGDDPAPTDISTNSPHWNDRIYELGSMWWETVLYAFDTDIDGVGGHDILLGHDGRDTVFGGPGDDIINGDGDGVVEVLDVNNPEFTQIVDIDASTLDRDMLFGGDNDDVIWGGRDNDILMGGYDADYLDVRPREAGDNGRKGGQFAEWDRDSPLWHTFAFPENFQGKDFIYGGWDQDALQADQAANGPDPGDRLADWAGGFNVFYVCPASYGDYTILRQGSPHSLQFLRDLTEASGAIGSDTEGTSGFRDLAYVFSSQRGDNSHPPHPDHAAHFTCADI